VRILGLTLIELIFVLSLMGVVSAKGVESVLHIHRKANVDSLHQIHLMINSMNTQIYSMALLQNIHKYSHASIKIDNADIPIQYGFVKNVEGLNDVLNLRPMTSHARFMDRVKEGQAYSPDATCALFYQAPNVWGGVANITINEQGC